jgi:hypothetical protein
VLEAAGLVASRLYDEPAAAARQSDQLVDNGNLLLFRYVLKHHSKVDRLRGAGVCSAPSLRAESVDFGGGVLL